MSLLVKICGLTDEAAVEAALAAGADAIGFVFHAASPRNVAPGRARDLAATIPAGVRRVAVTLHPAPALVANVLEEFAPDVWQTDAADFAALALPESLERWPVLRAGRALPEPLPVRFLFEGARSGSGEVADWSQAALLARAGELILGGGLDPRNVAEAVRRVRPFGVDVSSGVESAPGRKDPGRIRDFVAAAREAAAGATA
ncbi:MAG: phosphoribosylanthranilate isomerase [Steroidobacteraceae bacterium]|jgi:phosphoribosylanthranilate isomerase|nr:phosphoribosylanthranilate isomerase [Steroidobacteraceae bacterium]